MQRGFSFIIASVLFFVTPVFAGGTDLFFHAGVGQRSSLNEIKARFEDMNPGLNVNFSYKGSGYFIADITRSRQGDLFMPGEEFYLLQAKERGFIDDYDPAADIPAYFVTVIITPKGNPANIRKIEDFARPGVRVGLGNPRACAIGIWHEKTFTKAGIWEDVKKNAVMSAKCIPELGNATQHKAVDATIVWATTAVLYLRDAEIIPIEHRYRGVVRLPVAVLNFARHRDEAERLKAFILSDTGREIFHKHAYAIDTDIPVDEQGFTLDDSTDRDMECLVNAARALKDETYPATAETVGHLMEEVQRQKRTLRAGN
ncbi:MAG TPA: molybdate ABC transporter substrate-binding protein [Deltaproteobacteria bacterium]|nr:molybdate ABC transporter substrate-binding protein [Deltaproteobacteria bacterium]